MTSNSEEQPKKVTADKVQSALIEKEELFREGSHYEEAYSSQNGGSKRQMQVRKLQNAKNNNQMEYGQSGPNNGVGNDYESQRESKGPQTLPNGAIYTGQWLGGMKDGYGQ
jgi:hypothetical protein